MDSKIVYHLPTRPLTKAIAQDLDCGRIQSLARGIAPAVATLLDEAEATQLRQRLLLAEVADELRMLDAQLAAHLRQPAESPFLARLGVQLRALADRCAGAKR
jgi:hypothetical protein